MNEYAFQPIPPFRAHRLVAGGHLQTLVGCYLPQAKATYATELQHLELADGDILVLHEQRPVDWSAGGPVALMVHGLGGCGESLYMVRKADRLCAAGVRTFRLDLRGCGAGLALAKKVCNAACSLDVQAALERVIELCPASPVSVIGFSMGANIVLKLAGDLGSKIPAGLQHVIAVAPPIDLACCCTNIRRGLNRLYDWSFVECLNRLVARRRKEAPKARHILPPKRPRCLYDFDQCITAPLCGFESVEEYYRESSSAPLLKQICVPTLIMTADDDPVIPVSMFEEAEMSSHVDLHVTRSGGHLGFIARNGDDPDCRWLDWRLVEQVVGAYQQQKAPRAVAERRQLSVSAGNGPEHQVRS